MFQTLAEGGQTPIVISEGGRDKSDFGGGGAMVVLLFLIVIAVVLVPFVSRREAVAERGSALSEILPAMMVMQSATTRQTVDVNSHNTNPNGGGPSNFDLYRQGVATNDNVFVQNCQDRELIRSDGQATRDLINSQYVHGLELQLADKNAQILSINNQLVSERQFSALTAQSTANFNSLQTQINALSCQVPKTPVPAVAVSPYAGYRPGYVHTFHGCHDECRGDC